MDDAKAGPGAYTLMQGLREAIDSVARHPGPNEAGPYTV